MSMSVQFRRSISALLVMFMAQFGALPALAQSSSKVLFSHKHWQVEVVNWNDGSTGCVAQVTAPGESFSVWTFSTGQVQLQFFSTNWEFGEGQSADLQLQIDRRPVWKLTNAELYKNSVLFTLPNDDSGVNFLLEVAKGSRLYLRDSRGGGVQDYSLAGSRASMDALVKCSDVIQNGGRSKNPFN